jgi:trehalose 6-phosphate phosphatase
MLLHHGASEMVRDSGSDVATNPEPFAFQNTLPVFHGTWALFLDIDGTIADIAAKPDQAVIPAHTLKTLVRLRSLTDAVAFVSGRDLHAIDMMTSPYSFPAAGQHGLEIRQPDGKIKLCAASTENMSEIVEEIEGLKRCYPKLLIEKKGLSIAVHYRAAPKLEGVVTHFMEVLARSFPEMKLQVGKMVTEIQLRGGDKGLAIEAMMRMTPFKGRIPVFIGDDFTDHVGFDAVNRMNGISIQVGNELPSPHLSAAQYTIDSPKDLRAWLDSFLGCRQDNAPHPY